MPREFNYDVIKLIECVKLRSCIWDKTLENYKDRVERKTAWEEIFAILEEKYYEMTADEKVFVEEQIVTKWTNIRDTFLKTLKTKMGKQKKKYLYHQQLAFLTKNTPQPESTCDFNNDELPVTYLKEESEPKKRKKQRTKDEFIPSTKCQSFEADDYCDTVNEDVGFVQCEGSDEPRLMNEDEAFFASLLPTVVRYTLEERLDFRMEVLAVMKRIYDKKKWSD